MAEFCSVLADALLQLANLFGNGHTFCIVPISTCFFFSAISYLQLIICQDLIDEVTWLSLQNVMLCRPIRTLDKCTIPD